MLVVAVVVYDRFNNVREWIRCFSISVTDGAQLVIIHNYGDEDTRLAFQEYCNNLGVLYIPRSNVGYDIGAFQDVCRGRLEGFPEFDYLLWCTDDCIPMRRDFVKQYMDKIKIPGVGCVALEISPSVRRHIRTTCFCITKEVSTKLQFVADPITTKEQCYQFEHRGGSNIFMDQLLRMRFRAVQVAQIQSAPFWDSGFKKYKNREKEHYNMFPLPPQINAKVAFICPAFNTYPEIISSLINQTHKKWQLFLVHDGPSDLNIKAIVDAYADSRITYTETEERAGNWGHSLRQLYLKKLKDSDFDYIVITNADNWYAPVFCEYLLKAFTNGQVAAYCDQIIHSYTGWKVLNCRLGLGYIDCGQVMVKKDVACDVGWNDVTSHSSDWTYFKEIADKYGAHNFEPVKGCLFSHN